MEEVLLDPSIRSWVIVPILLITFLVGIGRHFASLLIQSPKTPAIDQIFATYVVREDSGGDRDDELIVLFTIQLESGRIRSHLVFCDVCRVS